MSANVKVAQSFTPSTFSFTSTSYIDLLDGSGGSPISVTITKAAGTDLLVRGSFGSVQQSANATITLGVNDGTNDHYLGENRGFSTCHVLTAGAKKISGLGAGTYTLKLRVKLDVANQCNFHTSDSASLMVMEVAA